MFSRPRPPLGSLLALCALALPAFAQPDPDPDVQITGEGAADLFGWALTRAGDVNGDQVPDLLVGAPGNDAVAGFAGRAYLFLGPLAGDLGAAEADAIVSAEAFGDNLGISVAGAGDVNDDGFDDILLGARGNDAAGIQAGRVYLFHGPVVGLLEALDADAIISGVAFEELGRAVAGVGDLNGDGFADLLLAAPLANVGAGFSGQVYVFLGPVSGFLPSSSADATISGVLFNELLGTSLATADLNGDDIPDLVLGAPRPPLSGADTGRVYVFFGPVSGAMSADEADVLVLGEQLNDDFGISVGAAGDVNGDGFDDLVVGADQLFANGSGRAYLFHGPLAGIVAAADADAIFLGETAEDIFGAAVAGAGDADGDGIGEVLVGAWDNGAGGGRAGRAYRFHGPLAGTIAAADADFIVTGAPSDRVGLAVAGAGDLDGDGLDETLVGAPQFDEADPGYAAVFSGTPAVLFADGFESGDTSAWSVTVP